MRRLLAAVLMLCSGCAHLPGHPPPRPQMKTADATATMASLAAGIVNQEPRAAADTWWQGFGRIDLNRLIDSALSGQPDLAAAQARLDAAKHAEHLARLEGGLQYSTDASLARHRLSDHGLLPVSVVGKLYTQADISQTVSYDLDWWGRNRSLLRAARDDHRAALDEVAAVRLDIAAAVADAYFAWAETAVQLAQVRELARCHRQQLDLLQHRHALGLDAAQPGLDARRKLDLDADRISQLEFLDRSWRYRLSALIGSDPDHAGELPTPSLDARLPELPDSLPLGWLARRPDIASLRDRIEAASARSDAARAEFYPDLDLKLMAGTESLDLGRLLDAGSVVGTLGLALHLPLFNTATLQARLGMREAEYRAAVATYNQAILDAARQSAEAYALVVSLEQRSRSQRSALTEAEQMHALAEQRAVLGLSSSLASLEAESVLLLQRISDSETRAARLRAHVALFRAIGGDTNLEDRP